MISFKLTDDIKEIKEKFVSAGFHTNKTFLKIFQEVTHRGIYRFYRFSFKCKNSNIHLEVHDDGFNTFFSNISTEFFSVVNDKIKIDCRGIQNKIDDLSKRRQRKTTNANAANVAKIIITAFVDGHLRNNNIKFEFNDYGTNIQYDCRISDMSFQLNFRFKSYEEMGDVDLNELAFKFGDCNKKINFKNFMETFNEYLKQAKEIKKSANNKIQELENKKQKLSKEYEKADNELCIWKSGKFFNLLNITC